MTKTPGVSLIAIASPTRTPGGIACSHRCRGRRRSSRQASTRKALTWAKRIPSPTGWVHRKTPTTSPTSTGAHTPTRCRSRYQANQAMPTLATSWAMVQPQAATSKGTKASGTARSAATGG